jgi:hypothetical protein
VASFVCLLEGAADLAGEFVYRPGAIGLAQMGADAGGTLHKLVAQVLGRPVVAHVVGHRYGAFAEVSRPFQQMLFDSSVSRHLFLFPQS